VVAGGRWLGLVLALGVCSGLVAQAFERGQLEALASDSRRLTFHARALSDPLPGRFGWRQVVRPVAVVSAPGAVTPWQGPALVVHTPGPVDAVVGDTVQITGRIQARSGFVERFPVAGVVADPDVVPVAADIGAVRGLANLIRGRVLGDLDLGDRGEALLAGFLVGDTSGVSDADLDSLRRAGLTHYVAVSGSNVALFLALWWLVLAPVARYPRLRALSGLAGVVVFALVTRAEPSVVRAGAMVSVLLVGRLFGWAFDRWTALAIGVLGCLAVSGRLAVDVGFALSVAATMGVMWGANRFTFEPKPVATVVGASLSAQVAVAPILLAVFGSMPLLSPLANLVAAPLVAASTATGGVGALAGVGPLVWLGSILADLVLFVAELAAPWPQAGPAVVLGVAALALVGWRFTGLRPCILRGVGGSGGVGGVPVRCQARRAGGGVPRRRAGRFGVDRGDGFTVLIDGGPDPVLLGRKLDEYGIGRIDLLIVSHVHADHIEGFCTLCRTQSFRSPFAHCAERGRFAHLLHIVQNAVVSLTFCTLCRRWVSSRRWGGRCWCRYPASRRTIGWPPTSRWRWSTAPT
jgi:competence protein ComEC